MIYVSENWAFNDFYATKQLPSVARGDGFVLCNFARMKPMTKIFEGIDFLKFDGCNLTNVDVWHNPTWIINWETCSYAQNEYDFTEDEDI